MPMLYRGASPDATLRAHRTANWRTALGKALRPSPIKNYDRHPAIHTQSTCSNRVGRPSRRPSRRQAQRMSSAKVPHVSTTISPHPPQLLLALQEGMAAACSMQTLPRIQRLLNCPQQPLSPPQCSLVSPPTPLTSPEALEPHSHESESRRKHCQQPHCTTRICEPHRGVTSRLGGQPRRTTQGFPPPESVRPRTARPCPAPPLAACPMPATLCHQLRGAPVPPIAATHHGRPSRTRQHRQNTVMQAVSAPATYPLAPPPRLLSHRIRATSTGVGVLARRGAWGVGHGAWGVGRGAWGTLVPLVPLVPLRTVAVALPLCLSL